MRKLGGNNQREQAYNYEGRNDDFTYGGQIGKNWLKSSNENPMPVHEYRQKLFAAMKQAQAKHVQRIIKQGSQQTPANMHIIRDYERISKTEVDSGKLKTISPIIPDFASQRNTIYKKSTGVLLECVGKDLNKRFFTVDQENFKYYVGQNDPVMKKALNLKESTAHIEKQNDQKDNIHGQIWTDKSKQYRVCIMLMERNKQPIYFYTENLHDAKFLMVNIQLYGNQFKTLQMQSLVELAYLLEKATRFQQIMKVLCFAKEKRFVQMHEFQQLSINLIDIASQAQNFRKQLMIKWFSNLLGDDEKPIVRSTFRSKNPQPVQKVTLTEKRVITAISKLTKFIKSRRFHRQQFISDYVTKQINDETEGMQVEELRMYNFNPNSGSQNHQDNMSGYYNALYISNGHCSLIFDSEDSYKFMTIENRTVSRSDAISKASTKRQIVENLIKKIDLADVSFVSTDLDQITQFDYGNKLNKQMSYNIKIFGKKVKKDDFMGLNNCVAPHQLGLDVLRNDQPDYKITFTQIKFPPKMANQSQGQEKLTLCLKVFQFKKAADTKSTPHFFESSGQTIKIKDQHSGSVYPTENQGSFNLNKLTADNNEQFAVGLVIRMVNRPMKIVSESLLEHEVLNSYMIGQTFQYEIVNREHSIVLNDYTGDRYEIKFRIDKPQADSIIAERQGKRLLVGRYALLNNKTVYIRSLSGNGNCEVIETISKMTHRVHFSNLELIETSGVNVFQLDKEPEFMAHSQFNWIIQMKVTDKKMLNTIISKIQYRQTSLQNIRTDTFVRDPDHTIEGKLVLSVIETKGLIVSDEVNHKQANQKLRIDPQVEIRLERIFGEVLQEHKLKAVQNKRIIKWGNKISPTDDLENEVNLDFGKVNHSGHNIEEQHEILDKRRNTHALKTQLKQIDQDEEKNKVFLHFIVRNAVDGTEIGDAKIELDELIDTNLRDLAKEYCVVLNRSHIIDKITEQKLQKIGINDEVKRKKIQDEMAKYTQYSGIISFQTLFQPTKDTSLRFVQMRDTSYFTSPKQLLHFEHLIERSDFDEFKFKIPQGSYNPNLKGLGEQMIDLQNLINQCDKNPKIQQLLKTLQSQGSTKNSIQQAKEAIINQKIDQEVITTIDQLIKFESPFEKLYIILKLQRKERPFVEQVFFSFKQIWDIYKQTVKNNAFNQLQTNEWLAWIDFVSSQTDFAGVIEDVTNPFELNKSYVSQSQDVNEISLTVNRTGFKGDYTSFVGNMLTKMVKKAADMQRQSKILSQSMMEGEAQLHVFSLIMSSEWEKQGNQLFFDLHSLIKSGVPALFRTVVWSDLMKTSLIEIETDKYLKANYTEYYNMKKSHYHMTREQLSCFNALFEISQKNDSVAFRQIDQDINDFMFPAFYFEESLDQNAKTTGDSSELNFPNQAQKEMERVNKMKHDKQQMRKLLRILLVWGKTFEKNKVKFQFAYPTGFLKVIHRFVNLMKIENAFWIIVGLIREFPRLWCLQESSMLDDAKSNFRFEMTCFKAILEVRYPLVVEKLYQLGLPIEELVYDSLTSLYSDYFHSQTLLRIWDLLIFYFNLKTAKRHLWLIFAPALLIIHLKTTSIVAARTAQEVIDAYKDGSSLEYNPNTVIEMLDSIIDDIFVTEGKQQNKKPLPQLNESGGTGSLPSTSKTWGGLFSKIQTSIPNLIDEKRKELQAKQNVIFEHQRHYNKLVSDFLFKNNDSDLNQTGKFPQRNTQRRRSNDSMEFIEDIASASGQKPKAHQILDYRHWRTYILPAIFNSIGMNDEINDDDLHEFEDVDISQKVSLDIKVIHIYLHELANWYGVGDDQEKFRIQVQYGRLHSNGKFEVKSNTQNDDESIQSDSNLQYFCNFKYSQGFNFIKVKIMKLNSDEKVCHCYVDLRSRLRGKFILLTKTMNAKEYTNNAESQFPLTQIKMSLFLESKRDKSEDDKVESEEVIKMSYLYSLQKQDKPLINIYRPKNEQFFQNTMINSLQSNVQFDYQNFKQYLAQESVVDIINSKYNYNEIMPATKFGNITSSMFANFLDQCLSDYANATSKNEILDFYNGLLNGKIEKSSLAEYMSKFATIDIDKLRNGEESTYDKNSQETNFFSLRNFVLSVVFLSPITVKEKLDILYDILNVTHKFEDGINIETITMLFQSVLRQHLYYLPFNELQNQVERAFNNGELCHIVGAYWTKKMVSDIKFDMSKDAENGVVQLVDFISSSVRAADHTKYAAVDITKEFLETVVMYQNLYGNKVLDFNNDSSPFEHINSIFASTGKSNLGELLLSKTKGFGDAIAKRYRLCIISKIARGERVVNEFEYDEVGKLRVRDEKQPHDKNKFKRFFMRNINMLNLHGETQSVGKKDFMDACRKIPFVFDLLRAETFWQDRKIDQAETQKKSTSTFKKDDGTSIASLKKKNKFQPQVTLFLNDKERIFIFKFENKIMASTDHTKIHELVPKQIYMFELGALFLEDIVLDMRDRIVNELTAAVERGMHISDNLISEIEGKMQFSVRKVAQQAATEDTPLRGGDSQNQAKWIWKDANDFDRLEKFSDDEVFQDEVIFKLYKKKGTQSEILDEKPLHILRGYDCYSIYKHTDNSYEWRLCKIVGKEIRPEYKTQAALNSAFNDFKLQVAKDADDNEDNKGFANLNKGTADDSEQYFFYLEFQHLATYGREMWCKRRREDILFSSNYARDDPKFDESIFKFILQNYKK